MMFLQSSRWRKLTRNFIVFTLDLALAASAFLGAYVTVFGVERAMQVSGLFDKTLGFTIVTAGAFLVFAPFKGAWRYVSVADLIVIMKAALTAVIIYTVAAFLLTRGENVPRSVPVLTLLFLVCLQAGARVGYRIVIESMGSIPGLSPARPADVRNVILCGMSDMAESFLRATRRNSSSNVRIVGIIDDSSINLGRMIHGVKVVGALDNLASVLATFQRRGFPVSEVIITEQSPSRRRIGEIVERANKNGVTVSRLPEFSELSVSGNGLNLEPRAIELGDLLERPEIKADLAGVARLIEGKVVMATGAGGSIGSELCRQIASFKPRRLIITDSSEHALYQLDMELRDAGLEIELVSRLMDVRNTQRVSQIFAEFKPQLVFHAAALKHVPMMEDNPLEAIKTNLLGTRNVADAALQNLADIFVMISTDKAVNPTNIMGATKRAAEAYCQALDVSSSHTRFKTVRFGNVLGSNGSVVPRFSEQIAAGGPITVTHPHIVRYFMTIPEAVRLVLHATSHAKEHRNERGKIMVLDMGKPVRIVDLAERMIQLAGFRPHQDIEIVFTGLRPGEKLYEELFDPSEVQDGRTEEGYVVASPRVIDRPLIERTLVEIGASITREDTARTISLLAHMVPEYRRMERPSSIVEEATGRLANIDRKPELPRAQPDQA
jgi:FlaA1/EpsC-like NDP-sugar epimerase